jgi:hypothetical protein
MKTLMIAAALCAGMMSAQAQDTPTENKGTTTTPATTPQKPVTRMDKKDCLMTTDADWKAMGLTADQLTKVKAIQAEHEKACAGMKKDDASAAMMTDKHEARIKEVLTPTQYDSWKKQCTAMTSPAKPMSKPVENPTEKK